MLAKQADQNLKDFLRCIASGRLGGSTKLEVAITKSVLWFLDLRSVLESSWVNRSELDPLILLALLNASSCLLCPWSGGICTVDTVVASSSVF